MDHPHPRVPQRIGPLAVGSGISVRMLDMPTLESLRDTCVFYERKAASQREQGYSSARLLYDLSRDIQKQLAFVLEQDNLKERRIRYLESICSEWTEVFGAGETRFLVTPLSLKNKIDAQSQRIAELEDELRREQEQHRGQISMMNEQMSQNVSSLKRTLAMDAEKVQDMAEELERLRVQHRPTFNRPTQPDVDIYPSPSRGGRRVDTNTLPDDPLKRYRILQTKLT